MCISISKTGNNFGYIKNCLTAFLLLHSIFRRETCIYHQDLHSHDRSMFPTPLRTKQTGF